MDEYSISSIETVEQGQETRYVAKRVFGTGSVLLLPRKPGWGFFAHDGKESVGGVLLEKMGPGEGLLSWIFVEQKAQGHRLGARLLEAGVQAMDQEGLTTQFSLVRGDNTASWNMFAKNGYTRPTVLKALFGYSAKGFPKRFGYSLTTGYSTWVRDESRNSGSVHPRRWAALKSLVFSLFIGAAMSLFSIRGLEFFVIGMVVVAGITALRMLVAYPIARMSGPVRFDAPQGGTTLSVILALAFGAWWPAFGLFVPKGDLWQDSEFNPYNGLQSFATWMISVLVFIAMSLFYPEIFGAGVRIILALVIVYQAIPFAPIDGMDGARVLRYSTVLYAIGVAVSAATIAIF